EVVRIEVDVVGDQRRAGADGYCTRLRVDRRGTLIGGALRVAADRLAQTLELATAHVGEVAPLGPPGGLLVEVDRDGKLGAHAGAQPPGGLYADRHVVGPDRHEGNHIGGPEARVGALVAGKVDQPGGSGDAAKGALTGCLSLAHEGDYAAVVVAVALAVHQGHARRAGDGGHDLVYDLGPAALGEVGNTLDQGHVSSLLS